MEPDEYEPPAIVEIEPVLAQLTSYTSDQPGTFGS